MELITTTTNMNVFQDANTFEHFQRVAKVFSESDMVPKQFQKNMANCIIALEMAMRMNASPMMVMQNLDVIHGKPCFSSKFLIASINASGRYTALNYESDSENGGRTRAFAKDLSSGEICYGTWVSMEMAKAEGWIDKNGSKWKTMPELMRNYRAAAFFQRQFAPELTMGLQTIEEIKETPYTEVTTVRKPLSISEANQNAENERLMKFIETAQSIEQLESIEVHIDKHDEENIMTILFNNRLKELNNK